MGEIESLAGYRDRFIRDRNLGGDTISEGHEHPQAELPLVVLRVSRQTRPDSQQLGAFGVLRDYARQIGYEVALILPAEGTRFLAWGRSGDGPAPDGAD